MNNSSDTITKLSDALTNLIQAYETLQKENDELKNKNSNLENLIHVLKKEKDDLGTNLSEMNTTTKKQDSNINSMLNKIENLLNVGGSSSNKKELKEIVIEEKKPVEISLEETNIFNSNNSPSVSKEPYKVDDIQLEKKEDDGKIDLNRMASLLNGFNH